MRLPIPRRADAHRPRRLSRRTLQALAVSLGVAALGLAVHRTLDRPAPLAGPGPTAHRVEGQPDPHHIVADTTARLRQIGPTHRYAPRGPVRGVVLLLSGAHGWDKAMDAQARALQASGLAVAGLSTPAFMAALERNADPCHSPNLALSVLTEDFEHRLPIGGYVKPVIAGRGTGAAVAYATLAQARGFFAGAVSIGFPPDLAGRKPWCPATGFAPARAPGQAGVWRLPPAPHLSAPWVVIAKADDTLRAPYLASFLSGVEPVRRVEPARPLAEAFAPLLPPMPRPVVMAHRAAPLADAPLADAPVADLPITPVVAQGAPATPLMAVLYSGDGGWVGLDREVAAGLARAGVPVAGVDSLSYFWSARTPAGAAADLGRIIAHYRRLWGRPRVVLVGYSFGADTLPAIVGHLPPALRPALARVSLIGLSPTADFQFHLASWLDIASRESQPTIPAIVKLRGVPVQCIRGSLERDSACPAIPRGAASLVTLPGGHHFGNDYDRVARTILAGLLP